MPLARILTLLIMWARRDKPTPHEGSEPWKRFDFLIKPSVLERKPRILINKPLSELGRAVGHTDDTFASCTNHADAPKPDVEG
jgi:hypothetical protein